MAQAYRLRHHPTGETADIETKHRPTEEEGVGHSDQPSYASSMFEFIIYKRI